MPRTHKRFLSIAALLLLAAVVPAAGQAGKGAAPNSDVDSGPDLAPVIIDGEPLFSVRGVTAFPAKRRAQQIQERIETIAQDPEFDPKSLTLEERPGGTAIMARGQPLLTVLDEDATIEQTSRARLAGVYQFRIAETIEAYRHDRRPSSLVLYGIYAVAATLALLIAGYLARRGVSRLRALLQRRYSAALGGLESRAHHVVRTDQVWQALTALLNLSWALGVIIMLFVYLDYALRWFPWTRGLAHSLLGVALNPLKTIALGFVAIIPNLVFLAVLAVIVRYLLKAVRTILQSVGEGKLIWHGFDPDWALPTYRMVRFLTVAFAVVVAYPYIPGSGSDAFKGVSLFVGLIFSLGSSSLTGNLIAGYSMVYRRTFKIGDRVKIGDHVGDVEQVRLLVTVLRTVKNEEVIIPNSVVLATDVVNYSSQGRTEGLIVHSKVGIGYETPWRQVEAMLIESVARTPRLRLEPPPFVLSTLEDFSVCYEINAYCDLPHKVASIRTDLHRNILDVFNEYGVQIMTPSYEGDPDQPKVVPKEHWYDAPAVAPSSNGIETRRTGVLSNGTGSPEKAVNQEQ
jgi:small-conductance mechanosensitive channel